MAASHDITSLLARARGGNPDALNRLVPIVYEELRVLAHRQRMRQRPSETLNTTALVHEVYEKLVPLDRSFVDRQHFFRVAVRTMRSVLVDHARAQGRQKRGGGLRPLSLDESFHVPPEQAGPLLDLDEALTRLAALDTRQAEIVELRYFVGLSIPEAAEVLGLSPATVKRDWTAARAWLYHALSDAA